MALNPSGQISIGGPTVGQSINLELGLAQNANSSLNQTNFRTLAGIPSGTISLSNFYGKSNGTQRAIFGFGFIPLISQNMTNLVSNTGVVATDTPGVGTARNYLAAAGYGGDKAIFGFGQVPTNPVATRFQNITNLVSNTGVVAANTPGVGSPRSGLAAAGYGGDKAIFGFGLTPGPTTMINLVSNTGVVATDTVPVGTAKQFLAAAGYGGDKAIFGFGGNPAPTPVVISITNLVSNTGVVATDTPGVGTARNYLAAAGYGGDKAIFGFGAIPAPTYTSITNLVSNTGVVAANTPGVGTARFGLAAAGYSST
jgi:hypothetical protein